MIASNIALDVDEILYLRRSPEKYLTLGKNIRYIREKVAEITQVELGNAILVCHDTISKIELGKCHPDVLTIDAIAQALDSIISQKSRYRVAVTSFLPHKGRTVEKFWRHRLDPVEVHRSMQVYRDLGQEIRNFREDCDLTQIKVGELIGTCHDTVSKIELGKCRPDILVVDAIAQVLSSKMQKAYGRTITVNDLLAGAAKARRINPIERNWRRIKNSINAA